MLVYTNNLKNNTRTHTHKYIPHSSFPCPTEMTFKIGEKKTFKIEGKKNVPKKLINMCVLPNLYRLNRC